MDVFTVNNVDGKEQRTFYVVKGSTICYFHVIQHFTKKNSVVKLIRNEDLKVTKSKVGWQNKTFYEHLRLIHLCKSNAQQNTVASLVILYNTGLPLVKRTLQIFSIDHTYIHHTAIRIMPAVTRLVCTVSEQP
jgi:hypothetical protein